MLTEEIKNYLSNGDYIEIFKVLVERKDLYPVFFHISDIEKQAKEKNILLEKWEMECILETLKDSFDKNVSVTNEEIFLQIDEQIKERKNNNKLVLSNKIKEIATNIDSIPLVDEQLIKTFKVPTNFETKFIKIDDSYINIQEIIAIIKFNGIASYNVILSDTSEKVLFANNIKPVMNHLDLFKIERKNKDIYLNLDQISKFQKSNDSYLIISKGERKFSESAFRHLEPLQLSDLK